MGLAIDNTVLAEQLRAIGRQAIDGTSAASDFQGIAAGMREVANDLVPRVDVSCRVKLTRSWAAEEGLGAIAGANVACRVWRAWVLREFEEAPEQWGWGEELADVSLQLDPEATLTFCEDESNMEIAFTGTLTFSYAGNLDLESSADAVQVLFYDTGAVHGRFELIEASEDDWANAPALGAWDTPSLSSEVFAAKHIKKQHALMTGRVVRVDSVQGYKGGGSDESAGWAVVRITNFDPANDITHHAEWTDSNFNVEVLHWGTEQDRDAGFTSCWIDGPSVSRAAQKEGS